ncbi:hypothetical protein EYF80_065015 [Liparis tanakae]|uniref:Uncharacterized protein n=1 Tax=Liparis tanakae TaxID=230148 RepID=A0A4Z2E7R6_9TELE|nr:hypothetical protein EYF80_065015 [Liparis tanakae]
MIPEHGQTGPALPEHVDGVDRHDDAAARHQDADPAVAEANGVVGHPEEDHGWTRQAGLTGRGRIRTVSVSKVTWARYAFTRGLKGGVRVRGGSL